MNEAEHILNVAERSRNEVARHRAEITALRNRNAAIREALIAGVSDRAIAIAAGLNRTQIWAISSREDATHAPPESVLTDVHAINAVYPCCGRQARFGDDDGAELYVLRWCRECRINWTVHRESLVETTRGRVDILRWENPATHADAA